MKQDTNRPIRTTSSQLVMVCASLTAWGIGVFGLFPLIDEIKSGQAYTLGGILLGVGTKVSRDTSPIVFWMNTGLHISGVLAAFITPIFSFREVIIEHKRKIDARKKYPSA